MCMQQLSPGRSGEVSLVGGHLPIPSPGLQHPGCPFQRTQRLFHEERECTLQAAELRPLLLRNQPAETPLLWPGSAPIQRLWATGEELCPMALECHPARNYINPPQRPAGPGAGVDGLTG